MKTPLAIGRSPARCQQRGAGLVEVLVAFLLISLATLGVVRLTANNIGIDKGTQLRLTALSLANQYAERARLNVYGFDLGLYAISPQDAVPPDQVGMGSWMAPP